MKVVCLIREEPPLIYFANKINDSNKLALLVIERPKLFSGGTLAKIRKHGVMHSIKILKGMLLKDRNKLHDYNELFGGAWKRVDSDIPILRVESINSKEVRDKLTKIKPDLILDHGTSIVRDEIIEIAPMALNLHWGLSPYYRGTRCTEWALIHWDPYNIGVTIHRLSKEIDGGDIVAQSRVIVEEKDTVNRINMKLTLTGTQLVLDIILRVMERKSLVFSEQNLNAGVVTSSKQWDTLLESYVTRTIRNAGVQEMLIRPARKKLPIAEHDLRVG